MKPTVGGDRRATRTGTRWPASSAPNATTLVFHLVNPAPDFPNILAMPFSSARPVEYDQYVPDSAQWRQHTLSDGPYEITKYVASKEFVLERNPAWNQASDPLRHAYVDEIDVTEGLTQDNVQQQIEAGTGDMDWDVTPPAQDLPKLEAAKDSRLVIGPSGPYYVAINTYLALNQYAGPMKNKLVRQAANYAVNKNAIVQIYGGPTIAAPANQVVLPGNVGYIKNYNPYPGQQRQRRSGQVEGAAREGRLSERPRDQAALLDDRPGPARRAGAAGEPRQGRLQGEARLGHAVRLLRQVPARPVARPSGTSGTSRRPAGSRTGSATTAARSSSRSSRARARARATTAATTAPVFNGFVDKALTATSHEPGRDVLAEGERADHEGRGHRARRVPEVDRVPLLAGAGLPVLLLGSELRSDEHLDQGIEPTGETQVVAEHDPLETGRHDLPVSAGLEAFVLARAGGARAVEVRPLAPGARDRGRLRAALRARCPASGSSSPAGRPPGAGTDRTCAFVRRATTST